MNISLLRLFQRRKESSANSSTKLKKVLITVALIIGVPVVLGTLILGGYIMYLMKDLPSIENLANPFAMSTVIYDRNGNELYKIHGEENRKVIPLDQVTEYVKQATIAIEDKNFYTRPFIDFGRIFKAMISNTISGEIHGGASTITQQLIKNVLLSKEQTYERKIKEAILAYQADQRYSRDEILEMYLNQIPYGSNAYGIEQASRTFFDKSASELNLVESAVLASLPNGPTYFSPFGQNPGRLMGYCSDGESVEEDAATSAEEAEQALPITNDSVNLDELELKVVATGDIWLSVTIDGDTANRQQLTIAAGEEKTFTADERLDINLGNPSPHLYINSLDVKIPQSLSLTITKDSVADVLVDPSQLEELRSFLAKKEEQAPIDVTCTGIEDPNWVPGRKDLVLMRMRDDGYITQEQVDEAWQQGLSLEFKRYRQEISYPHFVFYVKNYLEEQYGQDIETAGWKVYTTIDPKLQQEAEAVVQKYGEINENRFDATNAALVSMDPATGQIMTMVGSRDYWDEERDGNVNIITRKLQPGSSFKPFIFAAMFEGQYGTGSVLWDVRTGFGPLYPDNYDGSFKGPMTARRALATSRNIPAIKAYFLAGEEDKVLDFVSKLGITSLRDFKEQYNEGKPEEEKFHYGWPISLGTGEVTPLEMVTGYSVFANNGVRKPPVAILEIRDSEGNIIEQFDPSAKFEEVIDPQVAYQITDILSDEEERPAGFWRSQLSVPGHTTAAKTGTSNKRYPNDKILPNNLWTVGYTRHLVTAVWVGNNSGEAMNASATGLGAASPIFHDFMIQAHEGLEPLEFDRPEGLKEVVVSTLSGFLASAKTPNGYSALELFSNWGVPVKVDDSFEQVSIDKRNGFLANDLCPADAVTETVRFNVHSERPENEAWEKPVQQWAQQHLGAIASEEGEEATIVFDKESPLCREFAEDELPTVSIISPQAFGYVAKGKVNVKADIAAPFGIQKVEYYIDDYFQYSADEKPYDIGFVNMQHRFEDDSEHTIMVKVIDKNYNAATASVTVKIADDESAPNVSIVSPSSNDELPLGSTVQIAVDAYDDYSNVREVEIYFEGGLVERLVQVPFTTSLYLDPSEYSAGNATIKVVATDEHDNSETVSQQVKLVGGSGSSNSGGGDLQAYIDSPGAGATLAAYTPAKFSIGLNSSKVNGDYSIALMRQEAGKKAETIDSFSVSKDTQGTSFILYWNNPTPGSHEVFLMIRGGNSGVQYTSRRNVTVQ